MTSEVGMDWTVTKRESSRALKSRGTMGRDTLDGVLEKACREGGFPTFLTGLQLVGWIILSNTEG